MRLFITHGGQNSLLQAVYHAVPVLGIPLFGDQFDNVVRAEAKGLGLAISPTRITSKLLSSTIQTVIRNVRWLGKKTPAKSLKLNLQDLWSCKCLCNDIFLASILPVIPPPLVSSRQLCPSAVSTDHTPCPPHFDLCSGWSTSYTAEGELTWGLPHCSSRGIRDACWTCFASSWWVLPGSSFSAGFSARQAKVTVRKHNSSTLLGLCRCSS